jgi:hypothetical protein
LSYLSTALYSGKQVSRAGELLLDDNLAKKKPDEYDRAMDILAYHYPLSGLSENGATVQILIANNKSGFFNAMHAEQTSLSLQSFNLS